MAPLRTKDSYQKKVFDFINDIYVVCPGCASKALIKTPAYNFGKKEEADIKLICTKCGFNKRLNQKADVVLHTSSRKSIIGKYTIIGGAIDPYFHLPLWLRVDCCENILWAYNYEHLDFLKEHVEAKLRERNTQEMSNSSLGSRLPKWMTSKKNRDIILKSLALLKEKK